MENELNNFKITSGEEKLNFSNQSFGRFGFIVSPKYGDQIIYLPDKATDHSVALKYSLLKLFGEEKHNLYGAYQEKCREALKNNSYYMESTEISIPCFLASLGSIVFLNTGNNYFNSGLLFVPENIKDNSQFLSKINQVLEYLPKEDDLLSKIIVVPDINETLTNGRAWTEYNTVDYKVNSKQK